MRAWPLTTITSDIRFLPFHLGFRNVFTSKNGKNVRRRHFICISVCLCVLPICFECSPYKPYPCRLSLRLCCLFIFCCEHQLACRQLVHIQRLFANLCTSNVKIAKQCICNLHYICMVLRRFRKTFDFLIVKQICSLICQSNVHEMFKP